MPTPVVGRTESIDPKVLSRFLAQVKDGDFSARMPLEWTGAAGKIAAGLNDVVVAIQSFEAELARVGEGAGTQQIHSQKIVLGGWINSWSGGRESIDAPSRTMATPEGEPKRRSPEDGGDPGQVSADADGEMLERYANIILDSGRALLGRLNSILDLAKVESGVVAVEMTDVSLAGIRQVLLREFEQVAEERGLVYSVELASDTPAGIVTDPHRLHQLLENLLANAFEYTTSGEVDLHIALGDDDLNDGDETLKTSTVVAFSVRDTGAGIDPDQHRRIFDAFAQLDGVTAQDFGGAGLGLPISRSLVGLLGGEITVTSTQGEGSTFTVYLPLGLTPTSLPISVGAGKGSGPYEGFSFLQESPIGRNRVSADGAVGGSLADHPLAGMKVLVIDDDSRNLFAMRALLERGHAEVFTAEGGSDGITLLEERPDIDLVLMDIMMPGMDGYEAMRIIRTEGPFNSLPIIAVTGKVVAGERERCIAAGANDFLPKPVDTKNLFAVIAPFLEGAA